MTIDKRDKLFDSLKFILIYLVVLGHLIGSSIFIERYIKIFIYTFHMPLFVFISGYFSKNKTGNKIIKSSVNFFLIYTIFQSIDFIVHFPNKTIADTLLYPSYGLWYLISLIFWQITTYPLIKYKLKPIIVILFSFVILLLGATPLYTPILSLNKIIAFFPFFVIGLYCDNDIIEKIRSLNKFYSLSSLLIYICLIYYFSTNFSYEKTILFYSPYDTFRNELVGLLFRYLNFALVILISIPLINLNRGSFSKWGDKTLSIFLLHFLLIDIYRIILTYYNISSNLIMDICASFIVIAICLLLYRVKVIQYIINPISVFPRNK